MANKTLIWIVAGILVWWFFLRAKPSAAGTSAGTGATVGTAPASSAGQGLPASGLLFGATADQTFGPTYTTQPNDARAGSSSSSAAPSAGAISFPGDDMMSLTQ
jgi:hypothetical protein